MTTPLGAAGFSSGTGLLRSALAVATLTCLSMVALAQDAASLKARHASLGQSLSVNQFQRPLHLESSQGSDELKGDIYAQVDQPYSVAGPALQGADRWCDILILHLNVKRCSTSTALPGQPGNHRLSLNVGRKFDQPPDEAYRFDFGYKVVAAQPDYLQVALDADEGPMGTRRYRVMLEVVALDARRSFLHLSYSYAYGMAASVAMQGYLATVGRDKVGFSIVGRQADGRPIFIDGMRGVIERNTMRYYLAIEAYLGALSVPAAQQLDKRLNDWHSGVERYPIQLHELDRGEYLEMKRKEARPPLPPAG